MRACKKRTFTSIVGDDEEEEPPPVVWEQPRPAVSQAETSTVAADEATKTNAAVESASTEEQTPAEPAAAAEEAGSAPLETSAVDAGPVDEVPATQEQR
ncbi:hypothetical protein V5799_019946 [Amblyomma americanum]|uniref:Uncharacterized protein n=1 Tax=Amblyomma americanum TaxID=6943 RepID=A0AAQ4EV76_AMBAM